MPPVTTLEQSQIETLQIEVVPLTYYVKDATSSFHIHVYNSTGFQRFQNTANCSVHFYNNTNNHVSSQIMRGDSNGMDFTVTLPSNITSYKGIYGYVAWCEDNRTSQGGFVAGQIKVAELGYNPETNFLPVILAVLFVVGIAAMLGSSWNFSLYNRGDKEKNSIIKAFLIVIVFWLFLPIIQLANEYAVMEAMSLNVTTLLNIVYSTILWVDYVISAVLAVWFLYNLLLYLGIDIISSFRGKK